MSDLVRKITEGTLVPVSLVLVIMGGVAWLTTLHADVQSHSRTLVKIEAESQSQSDHIQRVRESLARIEQRLGIPPR